MRQPYTSCVASLAIFDLAGTLIDPVPGLITSHRHALSEVGCDFDELVEAHTELSAEHLVRAPAPSVYERLGVASDIQGQAVQAFQQRQVIDTWLEAVLFPGVDELLLTLLDGGWMLAVGTPQLQRIADRTMDQIGISNRFEFVAGNVAPRTRRPLEMVIASHLDSIAPPPEGIAVIGDRARDVQVAKALEATAIGAAWGFGSIDELMAANADAIAVTPEDVTELLLSS